MAFLQALPLILLLSLLASGRVAPVPACAAAIVLALPGIAATLPGDLPLARFLGEETARALFLGVQPVVILAGGLLFSLLAAPRAAAAPATPRRAYLAMLSGCFVETVTGFGVGAVFTLGAARGMGLGGTAAGVMALMSLCLAAWGGLGPGLALGAAVAGRPVAEVSLVTALPHAAWMLVLPPVLWGALGRAGLPVPGRERLAQAGMQVAVSALVLLNALFLPPEVVGVVAAGVVLLPALWRAAPPRGAAAWRRALAAIGPWALLTAALLLARSWQGAPAWRPFDGLPGVPVTHVGIVIWGVSLLILAGRADAPERLAETARRMRRPGAAMLLYVLLGRLLAGSGVAAALAAAIAGVLGPLAPYAVPPLGLLAGAVTGSNVGSASALMSVQAGLGAAAGLPPWLAPGLHNYAGAIGAGYSFAMTAMVCGLLADGTRPADLWRAALPLILSALLIGLAAVAALPVIAPALAPRLPTT